MKISILALHLGVGGVESYVVELANMLNKKNDVELILTYNTPENLELLLNKEIKVVHLTNEYPTHFKIKNNLNRKKYISVIPIIITNFLLLFKKYIKNINYLKENNSDVIITTRLFHNKLVNKFGDNYKVKIATEHNDYSMNSRYVKNIMKSISSFDYLLPISLSLSQMYEKMNTYESLRIFYLPFFVETLHSKKTINKTLSLKKKKIVFVGRLEVEKGVCEMMELFRLINEYDDEYELHIFGEGTLTSDPKFMKTRSLFEEKVTMHGFLEKKELFDEFLDSDYILITSERESFGIAALEAMSYGIIPLVKSTATGVVDNLAKHRQLVGDNVDQMFDIFKKVQKEGRNNKELLRSDILKTARKYSRYNTSQSIDTLFKEIERKVNK